MTNSTSEWLNSSPFVGEMILTIVAAQSRAQVVTGPPPSEMLRRSNERRLVVARKRTHEISNVDAVELISADPHEEYRDRGRSHPMTTDAAWVVHEWTYSTRLCLCLCCFFLATMQRHLAQLRLPSRRRFTTAQARDQGLPCARLLSAR